LAELTNFYFSIPERATLVPPTAQENQASEDTLTYPPLVLGPLPDTEIVFRPEGGFWNWNLPGSFT
jgi:hypothetical protein